MDSHTAQVFVKDKLFLLSGLVVSEQLWDIMPISEAGLNTKGLYDLANQLGIDPADVRENMTLKELADKVAKESTMDVKVVTIPFFAFFL